MQIIRSIYAILIGAVLSTSSLIAVEAQSWNSFGSGQINSFIPASLTLTGGPFDLTMTTYSTAVLDADPKMLNSITDPTVPITNSSPFPYMYFQEIVGSSYSIALQGTGQGVIPAGAMFFIGGIEPLKTVSIDFINDSFVNVNNQMVQQPMLNKTFVVTGTDSPGSIGLVYNDTTPGTLVAGAGPTGAIFLQNNSGTLIDRIEIGLDPSARLSGAFYIGYTNVPEPSTYLILATTIGIVILFAYRRKKCEKRS